MMDSFIFQLFEKTQCQIKLLGRRDRELAQESEKEDRPICGHRCPLTAKLTYLPANHSSKSCMSKLAGFLFFFANSEVLLSPALGKLLVKVSLSFDECGNGALE